jgi:hypothetical protein
VSDRESLVVVVIMATCYVGAVQLASSWRAAVLWKGNLREKPGKEPIDGEAWEQPARREERERQNNDKVSS